MKVECPVCGQWVEMVGRQVPCPNCGQLLAATWDRPLPPRKSSGAKSASSQPAGGLEDLEEVEDSRARRSLLQRPQAYEPPVPERQLPPWLVPSVIVGVAFIGLFLVLYFSMVKLSSYVTPPPAPAPPPPVAVAPPPPPASDPKGSQLFSFENQQASATPAPSAAPVAPPPPAVPVAQPATRPNFPVARAKLAKEDVVTDEAINSAIVRGVNYLLALFDDSGRNPQRAGNGYETGAHALDVLALLHAGQAISDERLNIKSPKMVAMIEHLKKLPVPDGLATYTRSLRAQALAVHNRPDDRAALAAELRWLIANSVKGSYSYKEPPTGATQPSEAGWDNSNSQYGVLGVWAAAEAGSTVPLSYWLDVQQHWETSQSKNGGWDYGTGGGNGTVSMTAAGVNMLFVANEMISATRPETQVARPPFSPALQAGLDWLGNGDNAVTLNDWKYYTLYGLERAGLACGFKTFGKHDWFRVLAAETLASQLADGSWNSGPGNDVDTAFALLFLSRGRHPLLMNKLHFVGAWANRPRDVARLTKFVSREIERPLNWQVVSLKSDWGDWMDSPVLYLASHEAPIFDEADFDKLRAYVNAGGLLFTQADGGATEFNQFAEILAIKLFKQELKPLPETHFVYNALFRPKEKLPLLGVSNGTRTLMIHSPSDIGVRWQTKKPTAERDPFDLGANLFVYATGMAVPRNRVDTLHVPDVPGAAAATIPIARLRHAGDWDPEPYAWQRAGRLFRVETSLALKPVAIDIEKLTPRLAPFAHLTGTSAVTLSDAQIAALKSYVQSGGVLLIDPCGGAKAFNDSIRAGLLAKAFAGQPPIEIPTDHPLLAGRGAGLTQIARPQVRPFVFRALGQKFPKLQLIESGRGAVLLSELDLTSGLLGTNTLGIVGFDPKYSHEFVRNAILWTINARGPVTPWGDATIASASTRPTTRATTSTTNATPTPMPTTTTALPR